MIIGITGASCVVFGARLLQLLHPLEIEIHLVVSRAGWQTLATETDIKPSELKALADVTYADNDIGAAIASGSFRTMGMIVAPCSMRTLSAIAHGYGGNLVTRAADVVLKERRRLVLLVRETPLHLGHLRNMTAVTEMGAIVYPPVPAMYSRPHSIEALIDHTLGRVLDLFEIDVRTAFRWGEVKA